MKRLKECTIVIIMTGVYIETEIQENALSCQSHHYKLIWIGSITGFFRSSSVPQMATAMQEHMSASMPESHQPYICYDNLLCLKDNTQHLLMLQPGLSPALNQGRS